MYKCSAVAEMGDRLATVDMGRKLGCVLLWRELGPHLTQCGVGRGLPSYQVASWSNQPFGHNRHGPKIGGCAPLGRVRELGPHLTQSGLGRGLPSYQMASWSIQPTGHNRHGPLIIRTQAKPAPVNFQSGGCCAPFRGELGSHLTQCGLGSGQRPTCMSSFILIHPAVWPQYTNVTDRTDRQTTSDRIGWTVFANGHPKTKVRSSYIGYHTVEQRILYSSV